MHRKSKKALLNYIEARIDSLYDQAKLFEDDGMDYAVMHIMDEIVELEDYRNEVLNYEVDNMF